ncbi:MAG: peptidoglycan DD-metalloendopeptidase family protein [Acutalibacteraceae bacterium]
MSELTQIIFHGEKHYLSSPFGKRDVIKTSKGNTSSFHSGADYATYGKKLKQYAVAKGRVLSCGIDADYGNAKYVWVEYPSLKVKMLHYHLDSISVKKGQAVDENTVLGTTGKTGYATGIHLHLGIKRIGANSYIDPEKWAKEEFSLLVKAKKYQPGLYRVTANLINVRTAPGTDNPKKTFSQLTADAQKKILALNGKQANGYVKGLTFSVLEIKDNWGRTPSGWVCLDYCERVD